MGAKAPKKINKITFTVKGHKCVISQPDFKQITFGLSALNDTSIGDLALAGKAVYDVCVLECDQAIKDDATMLMSVCIQIAKEYLLPYQVKIKKN